jgi:ascorbate PTS system EIIA or EIIAB component
LPNGNLANAFTRESVLLNRSAKSWREAIVLAGAGLVAGGITTEAYTQAMIEVVETNGPYIVIAPGFALAHARPSAEVLRWGMSLVTLAEPVHFGAGANDPVSAVAGLAAVDKDQHLEALALLGEKLTDSPDLVNSLLKLATFSDIIALLS